MAFKLTARRLLDVIPSHILDHKREVKGSIGCCQCKYFDEIEHASSAGLCRINPPTENGWPEVGYGDWCSKGEYRTLRDELENYHRQELNDQDCTAALKDTADEVLELTEDLKQLIEELKQLINARAN